ncbi:hypothetical protein JNW90_31655 [Micromonospora sp. STR1s_5]|nr:hypothetical protein [Micromonospora sp. STR1s_5]
MADITIMKTPAETGIAQLFDRLKGSLPGDVSVRESAIAGFAQRGLPHRRVEEFKYTDLRALMREAPPLAEKPGSADLAVAFNHAKAFTGLSAARLTIVNGHVASELSETASFPAGVEVTPMNAALAAGSGLLGSLGAVAAARENPVYELNTAFMAMVRFCALLPEWPSSRPCISASSILASRVLGQRHGCWSSSRKERR